MDAYLVWLLLGLVLVIVELLSGTFYLLVLGVGAFGAGAVAWSGGGFAAQSVAAAGVALVGAYFVHAYRARNAAQHKVAQEYVAAFSELAKQSNTLIVPANAADVAALITTAMTVMDKTRQTQAAAKGA